MNGAARVVRLKEAEYEVLTVDLFVDELRVLGLSGGAIDFANVDYVDSSVVAHLVSMLKRMRTEGNESTLTLVNLNAHVRKIFTITGLDALFDIR